MIKLTLPCRLVMQKVATLQIIFPFSFHGIGKPEDKILYLAVIPILDNIHVTVLTYLTTSMRRKNFILMITCLITFKFSQVK